MAKKTAYDRIIYALYYADELQEIGIINQLAEVTGISGISTQRIARLKLPSYMKRRESLDYKKQKFLIRC